MPVMQQTRTVTNNNSPAAGSLQPGQLAVEMGTPTRLWVGVPAAQDAAMQKKLYDSATAAAYLPLAGGQMTGPLNMAAGSTGVNLLDGTDLYVMGAANGANFVAPTQVNTAFGTWATQNIGFGIDDTVTPPRLRWKANGIDLGVIASGVVAGGDFLSLSGGVVTGSLTVNTGPVAINSGLTVAPPDLTGPGQGTLITINGGNTVAGSPLLGGGVLINGGNGGSGGNAIMTAGDGSSIAGGNANLYGGNGAAAGVMGGDSRIGGGRGGDGGSGGDAVVLGGAGGANSGDGGIAQITGGNAAIGGTGRGGAVSISPGFNGDSTNADILLNNLATTTRTNVSAVWNNLGALNIGVGTIIFAKTGVQPASQGLAEILMIEPIMFHRVDPDNRINEREELGFSEEQMQSALPPAVMTSATSTGEPRLSVDNTAVIAALVNAMKTMDARLTALGR
jgi:hypothetical protein